MFNNKKKQKFEKNLEKFIFTVWTAQVVYDTSFSDDK